MAFDIQSITKTKRLVAPKVVIYGPGKIGKSTFAASAPNSVGIVTEDGLHNIEADAFPKCTSLAEVYNAIGVLLEEDHGFKTVFLDSLDWLEPILYAHVCEGHGWKDIEAPGYGRGYIAAAEEWRTLLAGLDALRNERGMSVILIAHDQIKRFESPLLDSYDTYTLKLNSRTTDLVKEWADIIGFAQYRVFTRTKDTGINKKEIKAVSSGERILYLESRPAFVAGNRFGLPSEIPFSWNALSQALANSNPSTPL